MDQQLLASLDLPGGSEGWDPTIARVEGRGEVTVGNKAVVGLVAQGGAVIV